MAKYTAYDAPVCGILGLFQPDGSFDPNEIERRLAAAAEALRHRGPDARGAAILPEHHLGFGHVRLSILDLDARANQPLTSLDGAALIVLNGEIYNYMELRAELAAQGTCFRTTGDTEVLVHGYLAWGMERLLERVAGMFAFALYDTRRRTLFLARDRAGKKPLYFARSAQGWAFASEIRGLLPLLDRRPGLDPEGLESYLALKFVPAPGTLFAGIQKVRPGHHWTIPARGPARETRDWTPFAPALWERARALDAESLVAETETRIETAVARRLVSDVPVCVFLSGGIDSSLIAMKLRDLGQTGLCAYTIGYDDIPAASEFDYAERAAKHAGLEHRPVRMTARAAAAVLTDGAEWPDEPVADWTFLPLAELSQKAHGDGFKVALVGEGSDEIFFGYHSMAKGLALSRSWSRPGARARARALAALLKPVYRRSRRGHRRYDLWRRVAAGEPVYLGSSVGFGVSQRHQVVGPALRAHVARAGAPLDPGGRFVAGLHAAFDREAPDPTDLPTRIAFIEFYTKMGETLLVRVDRITMQHSLEARCPFLDHELVEWAFALPGAEKLREGRLKAHLKSVAERHLPPEIVHRRKMGFSFPFKEWLRGDLGPAVAAAFAGGRIFRDGWLDPRFPAALLAVHRRGRADHAPRLWALLSLCRWYDRWIDG